MQPTMDFTFSKKVKKLIKLRLGWRDFGKSLHPPCEGGAVLLGSPVHANLGDHLIAVESMRYIRRLGYSVVREVPEFAYELFPERLSLATDEVIFVAGGGWMGDLYEDELVIEDILARFEERRVVILPQTVHFGADKDGFGAATRLASLLKSRGSLILCVRDPMSFATCVDTLGMDEDSCMLLPDMGLLSLGSVESNDGARHGRVLLAMRDDEEARTELDTARLEDELCRRGLQVRRSSSVLDRKVVKKPERLALLDKKVAEFAEYDLVITDRLHSAVLALKAGCRCIAIDNLTHKVSGVLGTWLSGYGDVVVLDSKEVTAEAIEEMLRVPASAQGIDLLPAMGPLTQAMARG